MHSATLTTEPMNGNYAFAIMRILNASCRAAMREGSAFTVFHSRPVLTHVNGRPC